MMLHFMVLVSSNLVLVNSHGNMIHPPVWFDRGGERNKIGCHVLDLPEMEWESERARVTT